MSKEEKRIANVLCSLLSIIFNGESGAKSGYRIKTNAPSDLRVVGIAPGDSFMSARLYCESATFDLVAEGETIPEIAPFVYDVETL